MMEITGLSHLFKWENLHNWWLTKYFFAPLYLFDNCFISNLDLCICFVFFSKALLKPSVYPQNDLNVKEVLKSDFVVAVL